MIDTSQHLFDPARLMLLGAAMMAFVGGDALAQGKASVSSAAGRPNAVFLELPRDPDPCGAFLANMPPRYRNLTLQFGPVDLDTKTLFLLKCNEKKDELIGTITGPFEELKKNAEGAVQSEIDRVRNDLTGGFWAFVSEQMLAQLPESERQKYAPGSEEALALAHEWLNDPSAEFSLYVDAYFSQPGNGSRLYEAYRAYIDLTNGESKTILDSFRGVLDRARARLSQVLDANAAVEAADPDTPTADVLENVGLSGEWVDNFKSYEGQIRDFDKTWKVQDALTIMQGAFETDVPHEKVRAFFELMDTMSSVASDSKIPLVSLVGDIIGSYAQIANQTLDAVLALGEKIKQRHGFCLGLGVATDDPRSSYFSDQAILACPMALKTWPFRHIYEAQEKNSGQLYFWNGSTFIPGEGGGGRPGVLAALRLIEAAADLGYQLEKDPQDHVGLIGRVYNTAHPGGVPGLLVEAERILNALDGATRRFGRTLSISDACTEEQVLETVGERAAFSLSNFADELKRNGTSRLTATIAASFLALEGLIGSGRRTDAFQTYFEAEERLRDLSFFILEGRVLDQNRNPVADAGLDIRIRSGEEPRGCETWLADASGEFTIFAIGNAPRLAIDARALARGVASGIETFDVGHFQATSRQIRNEGNAMFVRAPAELTLQLAATDEPAAQPGEPRQDNGAESGNGGDSGGPSEQDEEARAAAICKAAEQSLEEALALAGDGKFAAARGLLNALKSGPCADIAAQAMELDGEIAQIVADAVEQARVAAGQCDVAALQSAAESLDALDDPAARAMQTDIGARVPVLSTAITRFEAARADYKAGKLPIARSGLTEARGLFQNLPGGIDCSQYIARIERGLGKIATLETALGKADQAITSCDANRIAAYESRFASLASEHVLIAGKAAQLTQALGHVSRAASLIGSAHGAQAQGETRRAARLLEDARRILDGPLGGSNCDTLRANLEIAEAQQPQPEPQETADAAGTSNGESADNRCTEFQPSRDRAISAYYDGRLDAARDLLAGLTRSMPDASQLEGCESIAGDVRLWSGRVNEALDLIAGAGDAIAACRLQDFDGLEAGLAGHPVTPATRALAGLREARTSCAAESADAGDSSPDNGDGDLQGGASSGSENATRSAGGAGAEPLAAASRDGGWRGTGTFSLSAAGQRIILNLGIELTLSNGRSSGNVTFFQEGKSIGRFPISGSFDGQRIFHEDRWSYEGLKIRNGFKGRFTSDTSIDGDGFLSLPEINCLARAIGEMAGSAAAGALGAFSDDDDGGDVPCPISRYPLSWSAQKQQ